jgi:hypothetical protein
MKPRSLPLFALVAALAGCAEAPPVAPSAPAPPAILAASVAENPVSVLSAVLVARVADADSVAVRFRLVGAVAAPEQATPAVRASDDSALVPILGLLPDTTYVMRAVAFGGADSVLGDSLPFRSGPLPVDLPRYQASGPDPTPGFVVLAAGKYGLVIDNSGRVVWYRRFDPNGPGLNFMAQPTGRYVARPTTPDPTDLDPWVELDPLGNITRTFGCARGLEPRFHDLIGEPGGGYWVMCDETRTMDLTADGGVAAASVMGTVVQHIGPSGELVFEWSPFDHFAITDLDPTLRISAGVNWTHGNSLLLDADGNLIVSFRSLAEITKINTVTGDVIWRMGGLRNQFAFAGTPMPAFARQHGVRLVGPGRLVLLDNLGDPAASRAERYDFSEAGRTARLVEAYGPLPAVVTQIGGSTQPLPGDRFLVSFGTEGKVQEVDATGRVQWEIVGNAGYVFRAQRIFSLYDPGLRLSR